MKMEKLSSFSTILDTRMPRNLLVCLDIITVARCRTTAYRRNIAGHALVRRAYKLIELIAVMMERLQTVHHAALSIGSRTASDEVDLLVGPAPSQRAGWLIVKWCNPTAIYVLSTSQFLHPKDPE